MSKANRILRLALLGLIVLVYLLDVGECARTSGGGGGGRVSGGSRAGGGVRTSGSSYGSSGSPAASGSSASRYGSSSASGSPSSSRTVSSSSNAASAPRSPSSSANAPPPPVRATPAVSSSNSATRWGSSAPSGTAANRNYQAAGGSAVRSSVNRPSANPPAPSQRLPTQAVYNTRTTVINNYGGGSAFSTGRTGFGGGSLLLAGAGGLFGGYLLGSMMTRSIYRDSHGCCYGCGYCQYYGPPPPWYYDSYVPYRYRYEAVSTVRDGPGSTGTGTNVVNVAPQAQPTSSVDLCTLARWNMELPFTELPNMALTFLASDNISGDSIGSKSRFLYEFLNTTGAPYGSLGATADVFTIPSSSDLKVCNFNIPKAASSQTNTSGTQKSDQSAWYAGGAMAIWREKVRNGDRQICFLASFANIPECSSGSTGSGPEEPFFTGIRQLQRWYSNISSDQQMVSDLVSSAKRCFPSDGSVTPPKQIIPCLDYSIDSSQVMSLQNATSIFGNDEVCRKYLNPDISKCSPEGSTFSCTVNDLVNLNVFARNYYLCAEPVDPDLVKYTYSFLMVQATAPIQTSLSLDSIRATSLFFCSRFFTNPAKSTSRFSY